MPSVTPIPAPPATPPVIGLLASITPEKTGDVRWENPESTVAYMPEGCNQSGAPTNPCDPDALPFPSPPETVEWKSYILTVSEACSTFGNMLDDSRIRRLMQADTERQLAAEFWDGALAQASLLTDGNPWPNTWLANDDAQFDYLTDGPVTLSHGMSCLDQYLLNNNSGQQGAIHVTGQTLSQWVTLRVAEFINGKWYSPNGNLIIASPGYSGNSPLGTTGTNDVWAYATDMPRIFLGGIQTFDLQTVTDRRNNFIRMQATRPALVEWQRCRHAGVQLGITACGEGGS